MVTMIMTFAVIAICGLIFLLWLNTPKGKRWLASL